MFLDNILHLDRSSFLLFAQIYYRRKTQVGAIN